MLSNRILFAVLSVLILAGLWFVFQPAPPATPAVPKVITPAAPVPVVPVPPQPTAFDLVVKDGKLASGPATLQVRQGEQVRLRIASDRNDELHLHGYELKLKIKAGEPATLEFEAKRSGRFELELHRRHTQLGALEVYPK